MDDFQSKLAQKLKIGQVFRPGTPIDKYALFAGRQQQVSEIIRAINQPGQHIVLFGERGVGKTSLSRVLVELLTALGMDVISPESINCDGTDDFGRIWHKIFREMFADFAALNRETPAYIGIDEEDLLYETPDDIRFALKRLSKPAIIVLDEVDRIQNSETTTLLADTIKTLSDHAIPTTLILIGVADSVDSLIQEHRSVERALVQVHLQRMSPVELREILNKGMTETGLIFEEEATRYIVNLSAGLPHYTHTLGLYAAERAIDASRDSVNKTDVDEAIRQAVKKPGSLLTAYEEATQSSQQTLYSQILLACAVVEKSERGYFSAANLRRPLEIIMGRRYDTPSFSKHLDAFCSEARGCVLQKFGDTRKHRFRFVNPLLQPFVVLHGLSKNLIDAEMLDALQRPMEAPSLLLEE